jgi:hypothetical protein
VHSRDALRRLRRQGPAFACALLTSGCASAPSVGVLGAYFPDWLFCIVGGVLLTAIVRLLARHVGAEKWLWPVALIYPALVVLFAAAGWLIVFEH